MELTGLLLWDLDSHSQHLLLELLLVAAHRAAAEVQPSQPRLLLDTAPVETGFANRTDEHLERVGLVPAHLLETDATFFVLEQSGFDQERFLGGSVVGAEGLETIVMLKKKSVFNSTRSVAHLSTRLHHATSGGSLLVTELASLRDEKRRKVCSAFEVFLEVFETYQF